MSKKITKESTQQEMRELIREKRKEKGLSLEKLAELVGVRGATLSDYETGKTALNSTTLEKVFKELEIFTIDKSKYDQVGFWEASKECAKMLVSEKIDIDKISQIELYNLTQIELVSTLENNLTDRKVINEEYSYEYFKSLVKFHIAVLSK